MKKSKRKKNRGKKRLQKATDFEKITTRIYELLSPKSKVVHNDKIWGNDSEKFRQVDVSIRSIIAGHEILIIVNCKDQQRRAGVNQVGELYSVMRDVGAHKGVLVCNSGFTDGAKKLSKKRGVELCGIHDAETMDWRLVIKAPVICEQLKPSVRFEFRFELKEPGKIGVKEFKTFQQSMVDKFNSEWLAGNIPFENERQNHEMFLEPKGTNQPPSKISCDIKIKRQFHFGYIDQLPKVKALKNESTGMMDLLISTASFADIGGSGFITIDHPESAPTEFTHHLKFLMTGTIEIVKNQGFSITGVELP